MSKNLFCKLTVQKSNVAHNLSVLSAIILFSVINCGLAPKLVNTSRYHKESVFGAKAQYTCLPDYEYVSGDRVKICEGDGEWMGEDLICKCKTEFSTGLL